jgi:predicted dinucleotide-binding enzyme
MRIAVLGAGPMGRALGRAWVRRGHAVTLSYARDRAALERVAREVGARAATPAVAVADAEVLLVAISWPRLDDVLAQVGPLAGRVVLTCSLPMTADDTALALGHTTSGAEELARRTGAHVVAAFNTVPSELITALVDSPGELEAPGQRHAVAYCGDPLAKPAAVRLIADAGFEPVDAGTLRTARYLEPFGLLVAQLAYAEGSAPALGYRFVRVEASDARSGVPAGHGAPHA